VDSDLPAIIAVAGTLLGSAVTQLFQRGSANRAEASSHRQQLRAERMTVYSDFAGAISDFRRSQLDRWHREIEDHNSDAAISSRMETYRLRAKSNHAMFRVQLVASDKPVIEAARHTYELASCMNDATSKDELISISKSAKKALEDFITLASIDVQPV
jgi:hypothetical protein